MFTRRQNQLHRRRQINARRARRRSFELLEHRVLLATAEGTPFSLNEVFDTSAITGTLSASVDWGDGTVTSGDVTVGGGGNLVARVDYSLDSNNFFDSQLKKDLFEQAVDTILSKFGDDLDAIAPSPGNTWRAEFAHPGTGAEYEMTDMSVSANEVVIFAGGRELGDSLGVAGPGGFNVSCTVASFCDAVATRGEENASGAGATDFGSWGGVVSFDTTTDFHFSQSLDGLTGTQKADFLSVALHEVAHVFGFGTSLAWQTYVSSNVFTGPASRAANGDQSVPLSPTGGHWENGTTSDGRETALDPSLTNGTRKLLTSLDYAALDDVGWDLISTNATVTAEHTYADDGDYDINVSLQGSTSGTATRMLQESVTNVSPLLTAASNQNVGFGQPFTITDIGMFSDAGFGPNETFTYSIDWGDGSVDDAGSATIDSGGSAGSPTQGSFDGSHTYASGGTYTVTVSVLDDNGGTDLATLQVVAATGLAVDIAADQISENAGENATTLTISRNVVDLSQALTVNLSTDTSELSLPAYVEIAAGESTVVVPVDAVDDDLLDGTQGVTVTATAVGFLPGSDIVIVTDHEELNLQFADASVSENAGESATQLTVTRSNTDIASSVLVFLANDNESVASLPPSVTIPFGEPSVTIAVDVIDNDLLGANLPIGITATASGYVAGSASLEVTDYETLTLVIDESIVLEGDGPQAATATVTRSNTNNSSELTVMLTADDTELVVPASVTIPAYQASVTFDIGTVDDMTNDGSQSVVVSASASGFVAMDATLQVAEALSWHNQALRWDVNGDGSVSPIDALLIINDLNSIGSRELVAPTGSDVPPFLDVSDDGYVAPNDVLYVINYLNGGGSAPEGELTTIEQLAQANTIGPLIVHSHQGNNRSRDYVIDASEDSTSEREIVLFADEFINTLRDDVISDIVSSLDRIA